MDFLPDTDLFYIIVIGKGSFGFGTFGIGNKTKNSLQPLAPGFEACGGNMARHDKVTTRIKRAGSIKSEQGGKKVENS